MKYLKVFQTENDYNTVKDTLEYPTVSHIVDSGENHYILNPLATPLYIEALADGMTVRLANRGYDFDAPNNELEYSTDLSTWSVLPMNTTSPSINTGERIYFRGNATSADLGNAIMGLGFFKTSQSCNVGGNIMSLLFNDDFVDKTDLTGCVGAFYRVFSEQPIVNASELILPATTLADMCYYDMFRDCTSLTTTPVLPATTLAVNCYSTMFFGCASLTTAPELPATTLADGCYFSMFGECTSLTTAPELPVTTLANDCYNGMFVGCTSLEVAPALPATTLTDYCYSGMFQDCTSLTTAPELPATTLSMGCYEYMFSDCTSLTTAPELPATTLAYECYDYMFYSCTSLTTAPVLPATTLAGNCYSSMFKRCTNLNYIKMLATDVSATSCLYRWVEGVSSTGTFIKNPALSEATIGRGNSGIPSGWTVVDAE